MGPKLAPNEWAPFIWGPFGSIWGPFYDLVLFAPGWGERAAPEGQLIGGPGAEPPGIWPTLDYVATLPYRDGTSYVLQRGGRC